MAHFETVQQLCDKEELTNLRTKNKQLRQQLDELLASLEKIVEFPATWEESREICYEALAKVKGGA